MPEIVIIGAGPAGLTAAWALAKRGEVATVLEADSVVGGISRTVERDGWRFDIGGHRFFTKATEAEEVWDELPPPEDFLVRPRMSRILYRRRFYDYPLRATNALRNLGPWEAARCVASYLWVRVRPPADQSTFEGWTASRFGWRLYRMFFQTYTEKVWGVPATAIGADWAAQRIKNLSLGTAMVRAVLPRRGRTDVTSLIEEFRYPKYGPGMMWEAAADKVLAAGTKVHLDTEVIRIERGPHGAVAVEAMADGAVTRYPATHVVSSMPLGALVRAMDPPAPPDVLAAADGLRHRDFLTVALVVPDRFAFPDNWLYIHEPDVRVGRIQNFGSWSPFLIKEGRTCLGMEYFVNQGDDLWARPDDELVALATAELASLGLVEEGQVETGYVVRMPKAYPVYDTTYAAKVDVLRAWLDEHAPNVWPVGRNGMHRYNNQDHSMVTAMRSVDNIFGAHHDVWAVNVEQEYHEEHTPGRPTGLEATSGATPGGTGRGAPITG